jgi:glycosyltransferase involved in cell wall biosynthesis
MTAGAVSPAITFDIYGPIEDRAYWSECQGLMARLPAAVAARYRGGLPPGDVLPTLARYHLFLFPTRGESFGRVIAEGLAAGCPLLLSDRTPWGRVAEAGAGWVVALERPEAFAVCLGTMLAMDGPAFRAMSAAARAVGLAAVAGGAEAIESNRRLFAEATGVEGGDRSCRDS